VNFLQISIVGKPMENELQSHAWLILKAPDHVAQVQQWLLVKMAKSAGLSVVGA
jgi:hypothetical protein